MNQQQRKNRSTRRMSSVAARSHQNKLLRFITTPYRVLCRARDLYVRSVTECGQPVSFAPSKSRLPRSSSVASSNSVESEDFRELVRAASVRTLTDSIEVEMMLRRQHQQKGPKSVPRSASVGVGMGRIDEETPFEGGDDEVGQSSFGKVGGGLRKNRADLLYPRSKSHAVMKRHAAF
uniref:Uncharacterized protein n=1 Tax=Kalanchoe fedtschenkoi TaxID=63787 RepID=A0A7N0TI05_KALFE